MFVTILLQFLLCCVVKAQDRAQPLAFHSLSLRSSTLVSSPLVMNGSSVRRPRMLQNWTRRNLVLVFLVLMIHSNPVATASCENASTLVEGELDATAIVYDENCNARSFQVVRNSVVERSLNLSNLNVIDVKSYPRVYQLLLNNNELEIFAPVDLDNDMEALELANNYITNLTKSHFPRRLSYLDLSSNSISTLSTSTPWPESGELQTLLLHGNSLNSVSAETFSSLVALQSLSLSNTGITNLDKLRLPVSLRTLNISKNSFTSASTNFSNLPTALQHLDLSDNLLTVFPTIVSALTTLVELNLESNGIKEIYGVTFASTLRKIYLNDNPLSTIEICRSDVSVFQSLIDFVAPSSISSSCTNSKAKSEEIQGVSFCVLEDDDCMITSISDVGSGSIENHDSTNSSATTNESETNSDVSIFSAESISIIGGLFLAIGILSTVLICGFLYYKRRNKTNDNPSHSAARKVNQERRYGSSGSNFIVLTSGERTARAIGNNQYEYRDVDGKNGNNSSYGDNSTKTPSGDTVWNVYESPLDKYHPVALLESSPKSSSFFGASTVSLQARSKIKSKINLDDLLVFEIPPEEIQMRRALHMSMSKKSSKAALALSSVGVGNVRKVDTALFLAEYQGYKVVIQALMRSKKRLEQHFVEQIRLAASLDHASIVHFIGITTGCSTSTSRNRGSSAAAQLASYASNGPKPNFNESRSKHTTMGAPAWHLGVVFEYMQYGSLASMFEAERHRREGKGFYPNKSIATTIGSGNGNIFSWYPVFANSSASVNANPNADWRCKLSIALDVAMGLVYLHANNYAHGRICAHKVLVNEQGEAKLSAMDILLPSDLLSKKGELHHTADDFRESLIENARWTMQKITSRVGKKPTTSNLGRSRYANNSGESNVSEISGATFDENHSPHDQNFVSDETLDKFDETRGNGGACISAQRDDVYAFGTFLWELDTMIAVEEDLASLRAPTGTGGNSQLLKFSSDCPMELQELARQCWHEIPTERPDAIDVQEELVRVLEGRLTTTGQVQPNWTRPSYVSDTSALSVLSSSELSSNMSSARTRKDVSMADL
ncbi:putative protein kinase domain, leucine-rich repeat domain superfamily [Plasmopara halstedii]